MASMSRARTLRPLALPHRRQGAELRGTSVVDVSGLQARISRAERRLESVI